MKPSNWFSLILFVGILAYGYFRESGPTDATSGNTSTVAAEAQAAPAATESAVPSAATNSTSDDAALRFAMPTSPKGMPEQILVNDAYVSSFNHTTLMPNWGAWRLTADHTTGDVQRKGISFTPDDRVAEAYRVTTYDYQRSGYDRGHMCPAADNKWSLQAMQQCFLLTNICPQDHGLNVGDWNEMENQCRRWARQYGEIYIVCGPILYRSNHKHIGQQHKVTVPEAFFKVVLCMKGQPKGIGFIYRNTDGNRPKGDYVNTIDEVERITGLDFFPSLPDKTEKAVEAHANLNDWY